MDGDPDLPPWAGLTRRGQLLWGVAFAIAYVLLAWAARWFEIPGSYSPWYPPAGIMLAYLLVAGPQLLPVALAVRITSDLILYPDVLRAQGLTAIILRSIVIATVYAWAAWVLRRSRLDHARLRQFGWFVVIGVIAAPLLVAMGVALVDAALLDVSSADAFASARTFWVGDSVAIASIVPFVLLSAFALRNGQARPHLPVSIGERVEIAGQAIALVLVPLALFALERDSALAPFLFVAILPVIWVALRQDLVVASAGILVTNTAVAIGARIRVGADGDQVQIQTVMLAAALAALYAGAVRRTNAISLAEVSRREEQLRTLVTHSPSLIARFDGDGQALLVPDRVPAAGSVDDGEVVTALEQRWATFGIAATPGVVVDHEWELDAADGTHSLHTRVVGERNLDGMPPSVLTVTSDRTELTRAREEADARARCDTLTGLPNRVAMIERLGVDAAPALVTVLIDRVDSTMAGLSVAESDRIMVSLADRLTAIVGPDDFLAHTSTHGFSIITSRADQAGQLAEAAVATIAAPLTPGSGELYLTASAGLVAPGRLEDAEVAMRLAQAAGGHRTVAFEPAMAVEAARVRELITGIRRAVDLDEFVVHYQPIVDLGDGSLVGSEALVRWERPGHGMVPPDEFIGAAERSGLIADIGIAVLARVTRELTAHPNGAATRFSVSVNVSASELREPAWADRILTSYRQLSAAGIDLEIELTETAVMEDPEQACVVLEKVRAGGVRVVLDDFGTGFSTISWLHRLPVDALKVDRSFVTNLTDDPDCARIVGVTISLAHELGLSITAEGIEDEGQRALLTELGCHRGQGYLFDRPIPLAELELRRSSPG